MPPRHAYWTIIVDDLPTAFRAADRDELRPTFERLRQKHPNAVLRWFARGRLWESPEAARRPPATRGDEQRGADWRPGGKHRDPRERFREERRARWRGVRERARMRRSGEERRESASTPKAPQVTGPRRPKPHEDQPAVPSAPPPPPPPGPDRPPRPGQEPPPVPSPFEEIVIPREPPERGTGRRPPKSPARPRRRR